MKDVHREHRNKNPLCASVVKVGGVKLDEALHPYVALGGRWSRHDPYDTSTCAQSDGRGVGSSRLESPGGVNELTEGYY